MKIIPGNLLVILFVLQSFVPATGQKERYESRLSAGFHQERREALRRLLPPNSVFVLFSAPEKTFSEDVDYVYHQNPDLFYFSGWTGPNSIMYIFSEEQKVPGIEKPFSEVLFTEVKSEAEESFLGKSMRSPEIMEELGIQLARNSSEFIDFPVDLSKFGMVITDLLPTDVREDSYGTSYDSMIEAFRSKAGIGPNPDEFSLMITRFLPMMQKDEQMQTFVSQVKSYVSENGIKVHPLISDLINSTSPESRISGVKEILSKFARFVQYEELTTSLRQVKTAEEIEVLKKAIDITCKAHREVMKAATPEMSERAIQGIHEFVYKLEGARDIGFPLIVASGNNGCVLHYQDNDVKAVGNTLVLMDVGAMYCGYSADVTRTIPANGKFSPEQLAIYNIVLEAQDSAYAYCRRGMPYQMLDMVTQKVIADGLKRLGIIKENEQVSTYYPHGVSHPIGLDVHDKFKPEISLSDNMIITLEPGIYIPVGSQCDKKWWGIAVRIEDDILINGNNPVNLSLSAPRKPADIETLMKKSSPINKL